MRYINKYLRNLKPYKMASHKVWSVPAGNRENILKLDWNEATQQPAPEVTEAISALIANPNFFNLYPLTYNDDLMTALSLYVGLPKANIQYFASSDSLHEYIAKLYVSVGDPVLILWPSYDNFRLTAEVNGAKLYYSELGKDFVFDGDKLIKDIERVNPSLVYVCNPNNPTGTFIDLRFIEEMLTRYPDIMFLIDEAYAEFANASVNPLALTHDNLLVTHTMSKAFALANFRFGYLVSAADNIAAISRIRNPKNITTFAQVAVTAALANLDYMHTYVDEVSQARDWFAKTVNAIFPKILFAYPSRGNFVLIKCVDAATKELLISGLEHHDIFIRNVSQSLSLQACVRVTVGTQEQMERVVEAMKDFLVVSKYDL